MEQDLKNRILSSKHILLVDSLILSLINFDFLTRVLETFWAMLASDFRAWEHTCWYSIIVFMILLFSFKHREKSLHVLFPILSKLDKKKKDLKHGIPYILFPGNCFIQIMKRVV